MLFIELQSQFCTSKISGAANWHALKRSAQSCQSTNFFRQSSRAMCMCSTHPSGDWVSIPVAIRARQKIMFSKRMQIGLQEEGCMPGSEVE